MIAPDAQKHVPMIRWFSGSFDKKELDPSLLKAKIMNQYSHDNIFHTILGLFEIKTTVYDKSLDIIDHAQKASHD